MWTGLQGTEDVEASIVAFNAYMASLDVRNTQAEHIVQAARGVLQVLVGLLTMHKEVGTCFYLLQRLLGAQCPLVESLFSQVANAIGKDFSLFDMHMATSHRCTAFAYDVSYTIGTYLNACVKASVKALVKDLVSEPGGKILSSFQYLRDKLRHGQYVVRPLPPSLQNPLATKEPERAAVARRTWEPAPVPTIV